MKSTKILSAAGAGRRSLSFVGLTSLAAFAAGCEGPVDAPDGEPLGTAGAAVQAPPQVLPDDAVTTVDMPEEITSWSFARYLPDGGVVTAFTAPGVDHSLIGYVDEDGGHFRCLTCGIDGGRDLGRPKPFRDGKRVLLQTPSNDSTAGEITFVVLECAPSVAECHSAQLLDIEGTSDPTAMQTRIASVSPDGHKLAWNRIRPDGYSMLLGELVRETSRYRVEDVRVVTPPAEDGSIDAFAAAGAWYEAKGFSPDGQSIVFAGTRDQALNLDSYLLDLATGATRRLTTDPDWDEWASLSPDGQWFVQSSSRGSNRTAVFGAFPRLPLLDFAVVGPLFNVFLPRKLPGQVPDASEEHRQYLFDIGGERPESTGLLLQVAEDLGWSSRHPTFSPDSERALWSAADEGHTPRLTRLRVADPGHAAGPQVTVLPTPTPAWAPPIEDVPTRGAVTARLFAGPAGGFAKLTMLGDLRHGQFELVYHGYSADGCSVLDGKQKVLATSPLTGSYSEDLTLTGCRTGHSALSFSFAGKLSAGTGDVELDGQHHHKTIHP